MATGAIRRIMSSPGVRKVGRRERSGTLSRISQMDSPDIEWCSEALVFETFSFNRGQLLPPKGRS